MIATFLPLLASAAGSGTLEPSSAATRFSACGSPPDLILGAAAFRFAGMHAGVAAHQGRECARVSSRAQRRNRRRDLPQIARTSMPAGQAAWQGAIFACDFCTLSTTRLLIALRDAGLQAPASSLPVQAAADSGPGPNRERQLAHQALQARYFDHSGERYDCREGEQVDACLALPRSLAIRVKSRPMKFAPRRAASVLS